MCGIFGYIGKDDAVKRILFGLKRLEYRGYDSWGVAVQSGSEIYISKKAGKIADMTAEKINLPKSNIGIGHTRWATTGKVSDINSHPHASSDRSFVLAHNGIVENYKEIKKGLAKKGYKFESETDTEVIVRLIEDKCKNNLDFRSAIQEAFAELEGRNTIIILKDNAQEIYAVRNGSPLVVGLDKNNSDIYLSSDTLSFAPFVQDIIVMDNRQMVHVNKSKISVYDIENGKEVSPVVEKLDMKNDKVDKEGYDHFMIKEINEDPYVVQQVINQDRDKIEELAEQIKRSKNVYVIGSGTTGIASAQIAYYLRTYGGIKVVNLIGAESTEYFGLFGEDDLLISPSQSGETADVLEVLEIAKSKGARIASYVNMAGSAMTRISDFRFMTNAGPEICVMCTKVFVSQLAWGYLLAKTLSGRYDEGIENLKELIKNMNFYLEDKKSMQQVMDLAHELAHVKDVFLMGKAQNLQIMNEAMVKLIEGTYKHAHAIPAGDLKHYAITLMEKGVTVIAAVSNDKVRSDMLNAINEVKARGSTVIGLAPENNELFDHLIKVPDTKETSAIMNIMPLQLLAYFLTVELGNDVDKPRNIAKSCTVK